jgi:hypothetical protein
LEAGCLEQGRALAEQALRLHRAQEPADGIAMGRRNLTVACLGEGDLEGARTQLDAGLSLTTTPSAVRAELVCHLVHLELARGHREAAAAALHEARDLHRRAGQADGSGLGRTLATTAELVEGPGR